MMDLEGYLNLSGRIIKLFAKEIPNGRVFDTGWTWKAVFDDIVDQYGEVEENKMYRYPCLARVRLRLR